MRVERLSALLAVFVASSFVARSSCLAEAEAQARRRGAPPQRPPARVTEIVIDKFARVEWQPQDNRFSSPGPVRITMRDEATGQQVVIDADDALAEPLLDPQGRATGDMKITVQGSVRLTRPEGTLTGRGLVYDSQQQTGEVSNAHGVVASQTATLTVSARKLQIIQDPKSPDRQVLIVSDASFTTCELARPDYHITARSARIRSDGRVNARNITFWLGPTRILSLPSLQRSFAHTSSSPLPLPGYHKQNGVQFRLANDIISEPATSLAYDLQVSLTHTPNGTVSYEHDLGSPAPSAAPPRTRVRLASQPLTSVLAASPALLRTAGDSDLYERRSTAYLLVAANTNVYNRRRTDLRMSRLPEIGVSLRNVFNRPDPYGADDRQAAPAERLLSPAFVNPTRWLMNVEASAGFYQEQPTDVESWRAGVRADAVSPLFRMAGPLFVRYGGSGWFNGYGTGDTYLLLAPEAEAGLLLSRTMLVGAAYRYQHDFGHTPFLFDRLDVRHELRLRGGYLGSRWASDVAVSYDLERKRAYDTLVSVRRRFDCMEVGLAYGFRAQSFNVILNLLPGRPPAAARATETPQR